MVPSNALTTAPAAIPGTTNPVELGLGYVGSFQAGYSASNAMFVATGPTDQLRHVYRMDLSNTAAVPTPVQVSNLVVPGTGTSAGCNDGYTTYQGSTADATTLFAVIEVPGTSGTCGTVSTGDVYDLISYNAAATAAPVQTPISPNADAVFNRTTLAGAIQVDTNGNLAFYTYNGSNFVEATTPILAGVTNGVGSSGYYASSGGGDEVFESVTVAAGKQLIGVNSSGGKTLQYAVQGTLGEQVNDATNLYFTDVTSTQVLVFFVPFGQSSVTATQIVALPVSTYGNVKLIGSAGGNLLFLGTTGSTTTTSTSQYSVAIAAAQTTVTQQGGSSSPGVEFSRAFLDSTSTYIYFELENVVTTGPTGTYARLLTPTSGGQSVNNSTFIAGNGVLEGAVFRESNLSTDSSGGTGGATFDVLNTQSIATGTIIDPQLMNPLTGLAYTVPTGYRFAGSFALQYSSPAVTTNIGSAQLYSAASAGDQAALVDLNLHQMVPVTISGATTTTTNIDNWN